MILKSDKRYDEKIGFLISHMIYIREKTKTLVQGLKIEELDINIDPLTNSIGTLLFHIAALEFKYQRLLFFNRSLTDVEFQKYQNALPGYMYTKKIKNNPLEFYYKELDDVKLETLHQLKTFDDSWLFKEKKWSEDFISNNYYLLQHLIDDEISHQGQIKLIKLRI